MLIGTICLFIGYPANAKYLSNKNCVSFSGHKIIGKPVCLGVKMTSLDQKHKIFVKVSNIGVSKLHISLKDIKSSGKLPVSV